VVEKSWGVTMLNDRKLIALISATPLAIAPAEAAIKATMDHVDVWNILDDRLVSDAASQGGLTPELSARMRVLINFALQYGADAVLLTCSVYGPVAMEYRGGSVRVFSPDQAVIDDVLKGPHERVLVVASFNEALEDSVFRLQQASAQYGRRITVTGVVATDALQCAKGDRSDLVTALSAAVEPYLAKSDVVLLAQYSLSPAQEDLEQQIDVPVLSGPRSAATHLRSELANKGPGGVIGAIADDYTGAIDVADALRSSGLRTLIYFETPERPTVLPVHDAIVIALKTRSTPAVEAVAESLAALEFLQEHQAEQIYFKYCSTFDSTVHGNIGPVMDALAQRLDAQVVVTTPSSPTHDRTVYQGHLYVGDMLLEDSPMSQHPLNPMKDSYLPRLLSEQTSTHIHALPLPVIQAGPGAICSWIAAWGDREPSFIVADGVADSDLDALATTQISSPLVAGAAGFALALGRVRARSIVRPVADEGLANLGSKRSAVLVGSCSISTLQQIADFQENGNPSYQLVADRGMTAKVLVEGALKWFDRLPTTAVPLFYSSVDPTELARIRSEIGGSQASAIFESALAEIACGLRDRGVVRFVVAGGESSGSVTRRLGVVGGIMGERVDDGVAWLYSTQVPALALLLKSGNFGAPDLFIRATDPKREWGTRRD
jgi:uncharacterized protein YgbK (DUF1537 family)